MQVQDAVRVENVTGQAPTTDLGAKAGQPVTAAPSFVQATVDDGGPPQSSPSPSGTLLDGDRVSGRIVRGLSALVNQRGGVMHMRLDPPDLGALRVQMTIARGAVAAEFQPTTVLAHSLLEQGLGVLRSALESHGLVVDRLTVQAAPPLPSALLREDAADQNHQQQGSGDGRFSEADRELGGDARDDAEGWGGAASRHDEQLGELLHQDESHADRHDGHSRGQAWARGPAWSLLRAFASSTPA
ncbi:MAG: flagellar hook-length control protein FliK [Planctomycetota bacterium]|jgi:flagellar hook-length control protein FliK